jgi:hypothetical protein
MSARARPRTFQLRIAQFRAKRIADFVPPALDHLCLELWKKAPTVADRHYPPLEYVSTGTGCVYLNRVDQRRNGDGVIAEFVSYVHGASPEQAAPDLDQQSVDIDSSPIIGRDGKHRQVVQSLRVGFKGPAAVFETSKGAGGAGSVSHMLSSVLRRQVDSDLPGFSFIDVIGKDLRRQIQAAGGVKRVAARLVGEVPRTGAAGRETMSDLRALVRGAKVVKAEIEAHDGLLDTEQAIQVWESLLRDDMGDSSVVLHLADGAKVDRLGRFKERRVFTIQHDRNGHPMVSECATAIWNYLDELRTPDASGWRLLDDDGWPLYGTDQLGEADD